MTLARTALRLAAVACLAGNDSGPTVAGARVYDSRIDDFSPETYPEDAKPAIIVLTDADEGDALSRQNGGPPFHRMIDLVFEIAMVQGVAEDGNYVLAYPDTDARHEASLDVLEFQIARRLQYDLSGMPTLFRSFVRARKHESHRQVMDESGVKIAARILTWTCEVNDDQVISYNTADDVPSGVAGLPQPLRRVAEAMASGSAGADICAGIIAALSPLTVGPLDGIDITVDANQGEDASDMFDVTVEIRSAMEMPQVVAAGGAVTIDYAKGTFQNLILAAGVSDISIINWPKNGKTGRLILKVTNTGAFNIAGDAWPAGTEWNGGDAPAVTAGAGAVDLLVLVTGSAGSETFGNIVGQNYR